MSLIGKSAIITGCSSGIGRAAALAFGAAGAHLTLADWNEQGETTAEEVRKAGGTAQFVKTDIGSEADVEHLVAEAVRVYGKLDCAFNNAGVGSPVVFTADFSLEEWERIVRIDLTGPFLCVKHEIRAMLKTGGGSIVNTASGLGLVAQAGAAPYCAAKAGVMGLTRVAAVEYAKQNIRVNAIMPGLIKTGMLAGASQEILNHAAGMHPIGRLGEPEEIAKTALWLCGDAPAFLTGHALAVDGGYLAV